MSCRTAFNVSPRYFPAFLSFGHLKGGASEPIASMKYLLAKLLSRGMKFTTEYQILTCPVTLAFIYLTCWFELVDCTSVPFMLLFRFSYKIALECFRDNGVLIAIWRSRQTEESSARTTLRSAMIAVNSPSKKGLCSHLPVRIVAIMDLHY